MVRRHFFMVLNMHRYILRIMKASFAPKAVSYHLAHGQNQALVDVQVLTPLYYLPLSKKSAFSERISIIHELSWSINVSRTKNYSSAAEGFATFHQFFNLSCQVGLYRTWLREGTVCSNEITFRLEHFWARRSRSLSPESSRNRRAPRRLTPSSRFSSSASSRV